MFKIINLCICLILCCALAHPLHAGTTIKASASLLDFNYEEFDQSGQSLNKETGIIPGLSITASKALAAFTNTISAKAYDGQVDYNGQTQSGVPHTTNTNETLYRLFYKLNWHPTDYGISIYGKVAWQQWNRDILPANNISGLFEQYQWWSYELGLAATLLESDSDKLILELGASRTSNGSIEIDLSPQGFGKPELKLSNGSGFSTALKYQHTLSNKNKISLSLQHQRWEFGRSNTKTVSDGFTTINITEPRSDSRHTILSISYIHYF